MLCKLPATQNDLAKSKVCFKLGETNFYILVFVVKVLETFGKSWKSFGRTEDALEKNEPIRQGN